MLHDFVNNLVVESSLMTIGRITHLNIGVAKERLRRQFAASQEAVAVPDQELATRIEALYEQRQRGGLDSVGRLLLEILSYRRKKLEGARTNG